MDTNYNDKSLGFSSVDEYYINQKLPDFNSIDYFIMPRETGVGLFIKNLAR